ncbi:MogA/MoaB family molybdenum cofactor biosynthesis protein [Desulfofundulus sp.]|uniref:MogA/MoaB family molybdenum cofactor biosynthesis protein n=1 Tax=Desulfofundulus sp. TaxID=2282750 RepID=UPI003C75A47D
MWRVGILTASDKGSRGEREDKSAQVIRDMVAGIRGEVVSYHIVPDDPDVLKEMLIKMADQEKLDLILTTGGTGFSPRDNTPEATRAVIEREVPGIPEAMRYESLKKTPRAMLSRAVAGIRHKTLIINLPGSARAVRECLEVILPVLPHGLEILTGRAGECGAD